METYVFSAPVTKEVKEHIMAASRQQLATILGVDVDDVMAGYVATMVANKKSMAQIATALLDFIGEDSVAVFVQWLGGTFLPSLEPKSSNASNAPSASPASTPPPASKSKRVISLKGISSGAPPAAPETHRSSGTASLRSLQGASEDKDMREVMARRSQRFGMPEKPVNASPKQTKRRASERDQEGDDDTSSNNNKGGERRRPTSAGGRLADRLGPPVARPEADKRDAPNKRRRTNSGRDRDGQRERGRDREHDRDADAGEERERGRDRERERERDERSTAQQRGRNRSQERGNRDSKEARPRRGNNEAPPLPPDDEMRGGEDRHDGAPRGAPPPGYGRYPGAPPGYPGYPPPGYGPPMGFYPPPPYGPMPPYDMGFHHHPRGPYMPPPPVPPSAPKPYQPGPRGPRGGFQNKKWVNPATAKAEEAEAAQGEPNGNAAATAADPAAATALNARAAPFMPRNPYFSSQMRPRFQNKTWVRPEAAAPVDGAAEAAKDAQLDASLPTTPPQDLADAS